ncbi:MAG: response regulator [Anaerolineales bacterium]|nr:response regulator [Anaerolineales bacterium]
MRVAWIVDDDDEMSHAVSLMLNLLDYSSEIFRDARSVAHQLLQGRRPDVFVLDINMPEVSGIDFLEFLRMRTEFKGIPVVMLSSETTDVQVDEAMGLGADAFVFKPVTLEELETALEKAIAAH